MSTRGDYGAQRSRLSRSNPSASKSPPPTTTKRSITLNCERQASGTALPRRVVSDGPRSDRSTVVQPNATLEYQSSDLFGYYASHELDWSHCITEQDAIQDSKMEKLLSSLHLTKYIPVFKKFGISYVGMQNMTCEHFAVLGVVGDNQIKLTKALKFVKYLVRSKATTTPSRKTPDDGIQHNDDLFGTSTATAATTASTGEEDTDQPEEILSLQRHRPRYMVSSRQWVDHYKGPYYGQNVNTFLGGPGVIKVGHGDSITVSNYCCLVWRV